LDEFFNCNIKRNTFVNPAIQGLPSCLLTSQQSPGGGLSIQLYPLDETFNKIERWKKLSETNPEIPFPEEAFNSQDWYEVSKELREIETEFGSEVTDSIHTTAE